MTCKKTIFHGLDLDDIKKFEEIVSNDNISCNISKDGSHIEPQDKCIEINVIVSLYGTDRDTQFRTAYNTYHSTYQEAIKDFLIWWDKEIIRFNSFNHLTKSNKK